MIENESPGWETVGLVVLGWSLVAINPIDTRASRLDKTGSDIPFEHKELLAITRPIHDDDDAGVEQIDANPICSARPNRIDCFCQFTATLM